MYQAHIEPFVGTLESVATGDVPAREVFERLARCGLSLGQAGNLTARVKGLAPVTTSWRLAEIERLLFLRWRVEQGLVPE